MTGPYATTAWTYRDAGWLGVLPLPPRKKAHPPAGWTGHAGGWPSNADIAAWVDEHPDGNIGLRLPLNIIGIDVDAYGSKRGATTIASARDRWGGLPHTWRSTNRQSGQGSILLFVVPTGLAWPGELGPGVELIQYAHRYLVAPPSVHPEGRTYRWVSPMGAEGFTIPHPDDLPALPDTWVQGITAGMLLGEHPHAGFTNREVSDWLSKHGDGDPCAEMRTILETYQQRFAAGGSRHEAARDAVRRITAAAAGGHRGMNVALRTVMTWFDASIAGDKDRPTDASEWRRLVDGAVQLVGTLTIPDHDPDATPDTIHIVDIPTVPRAGGVLSTVRTGGWLRVQSFPPLRYAIADLVPEGFTLLVGAPKIGKSFLALDFALATAADGHALGQLKARHAPVFYLALEDGDRRLQARCMALLGQDPIPDLFHYITQVQPVELLPLIAEWIGVHRNDTPLVILDTLGKVMPPAASGETTYQRDYRIAGELKRIIDTAPGSALLVNHHDRKQHASDFIDAVSGTHGLAGAADTTIVVARDRLSNDGVLKVTGRDVREGQYGVQFREGRWTLDGADLTQAEKAAAERAATFGLGSKKADIVEYVREHPGSSPFQVAAALDIPPANCQTYMSQLTQQGRLKRVARGSYEVPDPSQTPVGPISWLGQDPQPNQLIGPTGVQDAKTDQPNNPTDPTLPIEPTSPREIGPCIRCGTPTHRYGPQGNPRCDDCRD